MIKLLAVDLDGTLFAEDLVVATPVRAAIAAAQRAGVRVTLASGRMVRSVRPIAADLQIDTPVICYQGAVVHDLAAGRDLMHMRLAREVALEAIDFVHRRGLYCNAYVDDNLYVAEMNPATQVYASLNVGLPINPVGDLLRFVEHAANSPTKLSVVLPAEAATDILVADLLERFGALIYAVKSYPLFAEAVNPEANKGVALAALAEQLGVSREETMAVGDGANDIPMLSWAGVGVAMGQARPIVKAAASYVTSSLAEYGLAEAVERHILNDHHPDYV